MITENGKKTKVFKKGDRVVYIPPHVNGDVLNNACDRGVVSSTNDTFVFVKFDNGLLRFQCITGDEPVTAQGCYPENLIPEEEWRFLKDL